MTLTIVCCIATFIVGFVVALVCKALREDFKKFAASVSHNMGYWLMRLAMSLNSDYAVAWHCAVQKIALNKHIGSLQSDELARSFMLRVFDHPVYSGQLPLSEEYRDDEAKRIVVH